ncbi:glycoside hydrolase family 18 protein [Fulvivirgaceae bacterium BMA12]|uniref:chitinase n=1 Tax=Agaribacillus aureus TaxID=3051825 RepID=A0ABT8L0V6_9BACT|nr:glycoside hydrolase family 18 protein [Fulvivirgaceae bacterium BMA12]
MNKYCIFLSLTFLFSGYAPSQKASDIMENPFAIMAYYVAERDYRPEQLPLEKLTHIIFSFTNVIDGEMKFKNKKSAEKLKLLVAQKKKHPHLKVMIACGGWGADGFSDMAHTAENRTRFVNSAMAFIEAHQLDGLDIDWEYPGIPAAGTKHRKEDKQNFTLLMKALREEMNKLDRPQTLTFAAAGWKRYYDNIEITEVMKYVDYINVMTYDQIGANSPYTGHHTALGLIKEEDIAKYPYGAFMESRKEAMAKRGYRWEPRSVEKIVAFCLEAGVKREQIVIGGAFYGRAWKGVHPDKNGLYQRNGGSYIGWSAYHQIREKYEGKNGFQRHWDPVAKAPFLFNATDSIFISYDDTASVGLKTKYALDQKLGGIMFWELSNDTKEENSLLDAIYEAAQP